VFVIKKLKIKDFVGLDMVVIQLVNNNQESSNLGMEAEYAGDLQIVGQNPMELIVLKAKNYVETFVLKRQDNAHSLVWRH
jgi:hypothetical protein